MNLSDEELIWLNVVSGGEVAKTPAPFDVVRAAVPPLSDTEKVEIEERTGTPADALPILPAGALDPDEFEHHGRGSAMQPADDDPFAVFAPHASVPQEQSAAPVITATKPADGAKCPDCPHPAHLGAACTGKRGRGACRCGAQGAVEKATADTTAPMGGHLSTCVQNDAGKWLCMDGCTVAAGGGAGLTLTTANPGKAPDVLTGLKVPEIGRISGAAPNPPSNFQRDPPSATREAAEDRVEEDIYSHLPSGVAELARVQDEQGRPRGWSGTLQVNVNLGPETLALLQRLIGVKP